VFGIVMSEDQTERYPERMREAGTRVREDSETGEARRGMKRLGYLVSGDETLASLKEFNHWSDALPMAYTQHLWMYIT